MLQRTVFALSLAVRLYDNAGVAPADLRTALAVAGDILKDAGIVVMWRTGEDGRGESSAAPEVLLRIVTASPQSPDGSLGFSLVDVDRRTGTLATVFADRVTALGALAGTDAGPLLGRAMAHEIGHLLIGSTRHADRGLMRSVWTSVELRQNRPWDWALSREDVARMRRGLVARTHHPDAPGVLVAQRKHPVSGS